MRRTWRFLPSISSSPIQQVGTVLRNRIGGSRGGHLGLRIENPGAAGQRLALLEGEPCAELEQRLRRGHSLDLRPVFAFMGVAGMQQSLVQPGFVAQQQQPLGVRVKPAQGVNALGKAEFSQGAVGRTVRRKAGEDAAGLVEGDQHGKRVG